MEYNKIKDLPDTLKETLPKDAQTIYIKEFKKAWDEYEEEQGGEMDRESVAHRQGMKKVRDQYVFHEDTGEWSRRDEEPDEKDTGGEGLI